MAEKQSPESEKRTPTQEPKPAEFQQQEAPNLDPDFRVVLAMCLAVAALFGTYFYYRIDLRNGGPFAGYVNDVILGGDPHKQLWLGVVQPEVKASMESVKSMMKATKSAMSSATSSAISSARDEL